MSSTPAAVPPEGLALGAPLSEHRGKTVRLVVTTLLWIPFGLVGLGFAIAPLYLLIAQGSVPWPSVVLGLPVGLVVLAGTVGLVKENIENIGRRVLVLTGGLTDLRGGKVTTCHWEDIEEIRQEIVTRTGPLFSHTKHNYRVRVRGGTEHVFTHRLTGIEALRDALVERTYDRLLGKALEDIRQSGVAKFGALEVSQTGIIKRGEKLAWPEVKSIGVTALGQLAVRRQGSLINWHVEQASEVPNAHILIALVERIPRLGGLA